MGQNIGTEMHAQVEHYAQDLRGGAGGESLPGGSPRDVLVNIVMGALRAEAGVGQQQEHNRPTGYYAGRRAGFVASASTLASMLYGTDYEATKHLISNAVVHEGQNTPRADLRDPARSGMIAETIVAKALDVS